MTTTCSICLENLKNPVTTPCGHLHCENCISRVIEASGDAVNASCPTCRAPFCIAQPDLRFVPAKYHKFIMPSIRRVYFEAGPQDPSSSSSSATAVEEIQELQERVVQQEQRIASLMRDKDLLMDRCERHINASAHHAMKERIALVECQAMKKAMEKMKKEMDDLRKEAEQNKTKYDGLKGKLNDFKSRLEASPARCKAAASPSRSATKRTSTQAALDGTFLSSRGPPEQSDASRPVLPIPKRPRLCPRPQRPVLGSPLKLEEVPPPVFKKRTTSNSSSPSRLSSDEEDLLPYDNVRLPYKAVQSLKAKFVGPSEVSQTPQLRTPIPAFVTSTNSSTLASTNLPARSGLPAGDLFSPTRAAKASGSSSEMAVDGSNDDLAGSGFGSIDFGNSGEMTTNAFGEEDVEARKKTYIFRGSKVVLVGKHRFAKVEQD